MSITKLHFDFAFNVIVYTFVVKDLIIINKESFRCAYELKSDNEAFNQSHTLRYKLK